MTERIDSVDLIGRDAELDQLRRLLSTPGGPGAVLCGAGGVGKSRLARACIAHAEAFGFRSASVLATRSAASIPLGAFAAILPERGVEMAGLQAARRSLQELAAEQPLLLVVDDAHLLDEASASLVLTVAGDERIFPLLTVRSGEWTPDAVTAVWKDGLAERIEVAPLDATDSARLLAALLVGPASPDTVQRLTQLGGGRPLALRELVAQARGNGRLTQHQGVWQLAEGPLAPPSMVEIIEGTLDRLGGEARGLAETLALCEPLPLATVQRLGMGPALEALEARDIAQAQERGRDSLPSVLGSTGRTDGAPIVEIRLDHPLFAEVLTERVGVHRRHRLLTATADALAADAVTQSDRLRIVLWRHEAGDDLTPDTLVEAARWAYGDGDYPRCGALAGAAWAAERSFAAGHLLGFALGRDGQASDADRVLAETAPLATTDRERVLVTLARSENLLRGLGDLAASDQLCREGEAAVADPRWRAELTAHRAMGLLQSGAVSPALALLDPLLDPTVVGDRAFVKAAYAAGIGLVHAGRLDRATQVAIAALPVHEALWTQDLFQTEPGVHHLTTLFAMIASGRLLEVAPLLSLARDLTRHALPPYGYAWISYLSGLAALRQGRCLDATQHFATAAPLFVQARQDAVASWCWAGCSLAAAMRGEGDEADRCLAQAECLAVPGLALNQALLAEARGWAAMVRGRTAEAQAILSTGADQALARGDRYGGSLLLLTLARFGAADVALDRLTALRPAMDGDLIDLQVRHAAVIAGRGDGDSAAGVAEELAEHGCWVEAAEVLALVARRAVRSGDRRAATRASTSGLAHLQHAQGIRTPTTLTLDGAEPLTVRELEVARLAALRLTSREIAERLHISRRTVDNHLRNVYVKLGIERRTDLAAALAPRAPDPG